MTETTQARSATGLFSSYNLRRLRNSVVDLIFPPTCLHCSRVDFHLCPSCQQELADTPLQVLPTDVPPLLGIASSGLHIDLLQAGVQALKYHNMPEVARPLGLRLASLLSDLEWQVDMIVPVPLHAKRLQERGYNQAEQIAIHAAEAAGIPCMPAASQRVRFTQTQVGLSRNERLQNVIESFAADAALVRGKTILIVDDVKTTGATLAACAQPMLDSGATAVYALTVTAAT